MKNRGIHYETNKLYIEKYAFKFRNKFENELLAIGFSWGFWKERIDVFKHNQAKKIIKTFS